MIVVYAGWALALLVAGGTLWAVITFVHERAWRAVLVGLLLAATLLAGLLLLLLVPFPGREAWLGGGLLLGLAAAVLMVVVWGNTPLRVTGKPERVDERDAVFHRFYRLQPGSPEFEQYYEKRPALRRFDDAVRRLPDLAEAGSPAHHPLTSPLQLAAVEIMARLRQDLDGEWSRPAPQRVEVEAAEVTRRLEGYARHLGADLFGCTRLNSAWVYSHIGRGEGIWGESIELAHKNALVIGCRMSSRMVEQAPGAASTTETAVRYLQLGNIALVLARAIQLMGYRARAHVDGNYRVMCVPLAVDAGLGELGRLGLLVTPRFGPRVRLAVVTTDLPLLYNRPRSFGVADFCRRCLKCARACPSGSVDRGLPAVHNGVLKWQTRRDTCYRAWRRQGTDCNICVRVCPYSHPSGGLHRPVRWLAGRNPWARWAVLRADDLFYGRAGGGRRPPPEWHAP